jgi:O-antigen/teichoic acid export membrane protein
MKKFNFLISKLDSFFQLDIRKILSRASYLLGSQAVSNLLSFLVAVTAAHFVSKDTYGTYRYILSTVSFIGIFSLTGLSTAIVRSVARGYDDIYLSSFTRSLRWSLPSIIAGIGAGVWYFLHGNIVLGLSMTIGGIVFPFIQALLLHRSYLNGKKYFRALMKSNIAYSLVTSSTILLTLLFNPSVIALVCAYYISNVFITALLTIVIRKKFTPNNIPEPDSGKFEHHISLMNILDLGATHLDKIILFQIAGPIEVARYVFATLMPEQLRNIIKYISTLSMPIFSEMPKDTARSKGLFLAKKLILVTVPMVSLYIILAPIVYKILFPTYSEVILYSQVFALMLIFDGGITGTVLKAQKQIKSLYWINIGSNVVKIILLFILGIAFGIWGIIMSRVISRIISFAISYIALQRMPVKNYETI